MKHLDWPEDDRICHMPDTDDECPGCCNAVSPIKKYDTAWKCIWKVGHSIPHSDVWCCEWDNGGVMKRTNEIKSRLIDFGIGIDEIDEWLNRPISQNLAFVFDDSTAQEMIDDGLSSLLLSMLGDDPSCLWDEAEDEDKM
jgi:hypothetical protein